MHQVGTYYLSCHTFSNTSFPLKELLKVLEKEINLFNLISILWMQRKFKGNQFVKFVSTVQGFLKKKGSPEDEFPFFMNQ